MTVPAIALSAPVGPDDAPLLVLGSSLGTSSIMWESVLPHLTERYRVAVWDLPGHGAAPTPAEPFSVGEIADAVAAAVASFGVQRVLSAGVSLGGAVGLELLLRHPGLVEQAAIICSGAKIGEPAGWYERAADVRSMGTASLVIGSAERWFAPGSIAAHPELTGRLFNVLRDTDDAAYAWCCDALAGYDVRDRLGDIRIPVLAIWGHHDAVTPEAYAREIADGVRDGRALGIPHASHLAPVDDPDAVAAALLGFFDEQASEEQA